MMSVVAAKQKDRRPYQQVARAQAADENRQRMVLAARQILIEKGYQAMTMADVATAAEVARASVFRHFPHKAHLLRAVEAEAAERAGVMQLVADVLRLPPLQALRTAVRTGCQIWHAESRVFQEFYGTAPFDQTLAPLVIEKEQQRRQLLGELCARLSAAGHLNLNLSSEDEAAEALWLLTGFHTFDSLTRVRGLSLAQASALIENTVFQAFITKARKAKAQ